MKSLKRHIQESLIHEAVGNTVKLTRHLYLLLQQAAGNPWSKGTLERIEKNILKFLPVGSEIKYKDHSAVHSEPIIWAVDGKNWRQDLVPSKLASWNVTARELKISIGPSAESNMTDEELREAAASTTYKSALLKYLGIAKTKATKDFIQSCIDDLKKHNELE